MIVGIPKEVKVHEYRVGATPEMVRLLVEHGHRVLVQSQAGEAIGFSDKDFQVAGAKIASNAAEVYQSELIVKVKEPQHSEFSLMHEGQILFCFLHLAPDPDQTRHLLERKIIGVACETVTDENGHLPLLIPMSEIAGRIAIQVGATLLQLNNGGKGLLLGGVPGVPPANVAIIGGGIVGTQAARMAMGLGANVVIVDKDLGRLRNLEEQYGPLLRTRYSTPSAIEEVLTQADLVVGAVLVPGKTAPKLITHNMIKKMAPKSVFIDVAIDQGGCSETSRPTTHADPTYLVDEVIHYCVTNMPGACARTATLALTNATMKYIVEIADKGYLQALKDNAALRSGLNVYLGQITNSQVAIDLGYNYVPPEALLNL